LNHRQKNKEIHEIKKADKIEKAHEWQQIIEEMQNALVITYAKPFEIDNTNKYNFKKMTYDLSI